MTSGGRKKVCLPGATGLTSLCFLLPSSYTEPPMHIFGKKTSTTPQRVNSQSPKVRSAPMHTENAFLPAGGGNIDYGAARANQVAAKSRQEIEEKKQYDQFAERQSSAKMHESMNPQHALNQPGTSHRLSAVSTQTLVDVRDFREPQWAHHFASYGINAGLMGGLQDIYKMSLDEATAKVKKEKIKGKPVVQVVQHFGDDAARVSNEALGEMGITVSVKFYYDQAQNKCYYQFKVPASIEERDAWKNDLIAKYNLKS
jgi:hypothetical protein